MATPYNLVSADAQLRLTEFSDAFAAQLAIGAPNTWAKDFGQVISSGAIKTISPIPVSAAGYKLRQGDDKMRKLYERHVTIMPTEYQDGVQEKAMIIEAPDFIGWGEEPAKIANEAQRQPNNLVAALLKANPTLEFDGLPLFSASHPVNVLDDSVADVAGSKVFSNLFASGVVGSAIFANAIQSFGTRPGPNGQPLGVSNRVTHVLVPPALERKFAEFLNGDLMYSVMLGGSPADASSTNRAQSNIYKGAVQLVVGYELQEADQVYWIAAGGPKPWIVQDGGSPEEMRYDKDSDFYKDTGYIGVKYVLRMGCAAALPHGIAKQNITG